MTETFACDEQLPYQEWYQEVLDALHEPYAGLSQDVEHLLDQFPGARALLKECKEKIKRAASPSSPEDALQYLLEAAIDRFGYSASDVYRTVFDYDGTTQLHQRALYFNCKEFKDALWGVACNNKTDITICDRILALSLVYSVPFTRVDWKVDFKSQWVASMTMKKLISTEKVDLAELIRFFRQMPQRARWRSGRLMFESHPSSSSYLKRFSWKSL
ncbi:hypothetical protein CPB84DRAFT_1293837 [Gymnopilus junonius]|uniref:Uncharacterized protein n=1 Tax=Gymnopilus junonius TaxID=109634 RepID=A0A9P5NK03_GYMJU|nr:hypothetical protein CPB84DRAFT_1293837 [Gymnopilus junonius]